MGGMKIRTLVILAVLVCGLAAILPLAWSGADVFSSFYRESTARELEANARMFSLAVTAGGGGANIQDIVGLARTDSATRYTLIQADGTVVADSDEDAGRMENHQNRPEIMTALSGGVGIGTRSSPTLGAEWMYVAVPHGNGGVARAAASLEELDRRIRQWWMKALGGFALSFVILVALAAVVSRILSKPIEMAAEGAERYSRGELSYKVPLRGAAEMRRLVTSMGLMATELDSRLKMVNRQREEMTAVFENMSEGILAVEDEGHIMLVNGTAKSLFNIRQDVHGAPVEAVVRNADLLDVIRETRETNRPLEREIRVRGESDTDSLVQVHTARIEDDCNTGVLMVLRDVTRIRHLEIMRRDFVANVSHELRTPITAIQSCLETILDDDAAVNPAPHGEFIEMALRNTKRMGAIIDNLLFLAGMESGSGVKTGTIGQNRVGPVLDEAVSLCSEEARSRDAAVDVLCDPDLTARMNPQLVVHAVVNLLDNAIKYGPDAGKITVTAEKVGDRVRITISDEGPGIASRFHSRVFERFYRVDGATRVKKGSGLGLAIAKHIALAHNGDIQLESDIGAGSKFTLSLPSE